MVFLHLEVTNCDFKSYLSLREDGVDAAISGNPRVSSPRFAGHALCPAPSPPPPRFARPCPAVTPTPHAPPIHPPVGTRRAVSLHPRDSVIPLQPVLVKPVLVKTGNGNPGVAVDTGLHRYDELISGTGNRLAHDYMDVDLDIVWTIVSRSAWCSSPRRKIHVEGEEDLQ